jgi:predicted dehydrogenase
VRWTEQRNFEAVLDMMAAGKLDTAPLVTHRFAVADAAKGYDVLASGEKSLGILLTYPSPVSERMATRIALAPEPQGAPGAASTGFIGAGNYGGRVLIDAFKQAGAVLRSIVSSSGVSATHYGRKLGFQSVATDAKAIFEDAGIDSVCIASRHDSHAGYVLSALDAGKNVFVEKPLCLTLSELDAIAARAGRTLLMVGFNRRFAPMIVRAEALLASVPEPKSFVMTVNAGAIPNDHWTQDTAQGGGRIVGEGCHFIDLLRHLAASPIMDFDVTGLARAGGPQSTDIATITLRFADGSFGVVNYLANGSKAYPKERLEIFCAGRVLLLDNFRKLTGYGWPGFSGMRAWRQDKGQRACAAAFVGAVKTGSPSPIPLEEILEVSRVSIEAAARA